MKRLYPKHLKAPRSEARIQLSKESREYAQLLIQEAQVRRDFGEEGVKRFWEEVERRADAHK